MNNPYQQNLDIVKGFFRRPVVLVYAIVSALPLIAAIFIDYPGIIGVLGKNFSALIQDTNAPESYYSVLFVPVFEIAVGLSFLYFFIHSRSENKTLGMPSKLYRILSMIWLVLTALFSIALIFALSLAALYSLEKFPVGVNIALLPVLSALVPVIFLTAIGQAVFSGSIKESSSSIFLKRRGSVLFGVMSIISAVLLLYIAGASAFYVFNYLEELGSFMIPFYIFSGLTAARHIFSAVVALSYNSYIKKLAVDFVTEPADNEETEAPSADAAPPAPPAPQVIICKKCGKQLNQDDYFCNHCGTPVEK